LPQISQVLARYLVFAITFPHRSKSRLTAVLDGSIIDCVVITQSVLDFICTATA
jgi:hypothetical protein